MPFFETGAFWANHTPPEWTPGQGRVMLEAYQYKEVLPMKKPASLADAAAIAQFRLAIIAPVIHNLYPDKLMPCALPGRRWECSAGSFGKGR